jgi:hypothetical protein
MSIIPGEAMNMTIYSSLAADENLSNDTLRQFSIVYPGVQRNVLLEEWTSSTCPPCAANNPTVDAFISSKFDSLVAIKYHMNWPAPGNDPMYLYNPTQANDRRFYYGISSVPNIIMDGKVDPIYPYTTAGSLPNAFNQCMAKGTPISISVTDSRLQGDTIQADISVTILAPLPFGNYYLRVHAVERKITYTTPPGTNGESIFYDVFRKAYPTSLGTSIPTTIGTHNFTFKYKIDKTVWVDSLIYTAAFIQNDLNREIMNCGKGRHNQAAFVNLVSLNPSFEAKSREFANDIIEGKYESSGSLKESLSSTFQFEVFENEFPPSGWKLVNPNGDITFAQVDGVNGTSFGGTKSVKMDFYSYSQTGRTDTLYTRIFSGLTGLDSLKFDYAYAQYDASYSDRLIVKVSLDGGLTFPNTIFDKAGSVLATAEMTTSPFVPNNSQWGKFSYSLNFIPVELTSFTSEIVNNNVSLKWTTATELNNRGFEVQRSFNGNDFSTITFIPGYGNSTQINHYSFTDNLNLNKSETIYYRLKQIDLDGTFKFSQVVSVEFEILPEYSLNQNYPNPFNPITLIKFSIPKEEHVILKVYDLMGREVVQLVNERKWSGNYEIKLDASELSSGMYIYKLTAGNYQSLRKMVLIK